MSENIALRPDGENAEKPVDPLCMKLTCLHYIYCSAVASWLINLALAAMLFLVSCILNGRPFKLIIFAGWCFFMACPFLLITRILRAMLLYRYWEMVPPDRAVVTPKKAVLPLFIPLFNLYWNFVAILKLGHFLSEETEDCKVQSRALNYSIWTVFVFWTTVFVLNPVGELILMISFFKAVKRLRNWR